MTAEPAQQVGIEEQDGKHILLPLSIPRTENHQRWQCAGPCWAYLAGCKTLG